MNMKWWAQTLDCLLKRKGSSKNQLEKTGIIPRRQVLRAYQGPYGPSIVILQRILNGTGATWHDWANAYDEIKRTDQRTSPIIPKRRHEAMGKDEEIHALKKGRKTA